MFDPSGGVRIHREATGRCLRWFRQALRQARLCLGLLLFPASGQGQDTQAAQPKPEAASKAQAAAPFAAWKTTLEGRAEVGVLGGYTVRPGTLPALRLSIRARPETRQGALKVRLPLSLSHRQTFGSSLTQLRAKAGAEANYRATKKLHSYGAAQLLGVWRPAWPDLYQPLGGARYETTSRYSYWGPELLLGVNGRPIRHQSARAEFGYSYKDYRTDPNYDTVVPTHLVPGDQSSIFGRLAWHYFTKQTRSGLTLRLESRKFAASFSRDAGSGKTHAAPGGPAANPLQHFLIFAPTALFKWKTDKRRSRRFEVALRYTHLVQSDRFEGYYSYQAPRPALSVRFAPSASFDLEASLGAELRLYGAGSYEAGKSHPALQYGTLRQAALVHASLKGSLKIASGLRATLSASYAHRRTNFPDYEPRVYPPTRDYNLQWDYDTLWVLAGVRYATSL